METATERTPAQAEASRMNGSKSVGPVTPEGKSVSSMNGIAHGLASRGVLLPSERQEDYQSMAQSWLDTLRPASPAETTIALTLADLSFRTDRLARLEEKLVTKAIEAKLKDSESMKALTVAREANEVVTGLAGVADNINAAVEAQAVVNLVPVMRHVIQMVIRVELPLPLSAALATAVDELVVDSFEDKVLPESFVAVAKACHDVQAALATKLVELDAHVAAERECLADEVVMGDDVELRRLERHRARLAGQQEQQLNLLKMVRELSPTSSSGSLGQPVLVELRLVGRRDG